MNSQIRDPRDAPFSPAPLNGAEIPVEYARHPDVVFSLNTNRNFLNPVLFLFIMLAGIGEVYAQNIAPSITGQVALSTPQETSIEILLSHLEVTDPDNPYPTGFTLSAFSGDNYLLDQNTVTPSPGFTGTLTVPVTVNDGEASSEVFNLSISVTPAEPENIKPVITGQSPISTQESTPVTVNFSDLIVEDPDDTYPTGFSMTIFVGANYTVTGQAITPSAGFTGTLNIPVTVNDGELESDPFTLIVSVNAKPPENVAPVITGQTSLTTAQDTPITIAFTDLTVNDPDDAYPAGFTMSLSSGTNYTVSNSTVTPANGFTGSLTVPVTVNDGEASSSPFSLSITVTASVPENVKPVITGQAPLSTEEGKSITIRLSDLIVTDSDDDYPNGFSMTLSNGPNYTLSGNNVNPVSGFTGTLTVPVTVNDGTDESDPFSLQINVDPKQSSNVKPSIIGQAPLSIQNTESVTIQLTHLIVTDPDNSYPADFTLQVFNGNDYNLTGTTITPHGGFTGVLTVKVKVNDGTDDSNFFDLKITVSAPPANVRPTITGQQELTTFKNTAVTLRLTHFIVNDPDDLYPENFTLEVATGINYTVRGATITPAPGFTGNLSIPVRVNDGADWSENFNATVAVVERDELRITGQEEIIVEEDSIVMLNFSLLKVNDPSGSFPTGYTLVILPGENYTASGSSISPAANFSGMLEVPVQVKNTSVASNIFKLLILVSADNDAPLFSIFENSAIPYTPGDGNITLASEIVPSDPDNQQLVFAEVYIDPVSFSLGMDALLVSSSTNIRGVFDPNTGTLILLGIASLEEYQGVLRSVQYQFSNDTLPSVREKNIHFRLNDGEAFSQVYTKSIIMTESITLDIPNVFTPNDDLANDTWILTRQNQADNTTANIRVFDKRGVMVYESGSMEEAWDGRYLGEYLPSDTYYYTIEINSQANKISKKGIVTILR
jgi:gliding motility-associated-like protein